MDSELNQLELIPDDFQLKGAEFAHVFRSMMDLGIIASMSGPALKVYIIIKILSGFESGETTASSEVIGQKAGLSRSQVTRAVKELKGSGLLFSERRGRRNTYRIIEKISAVHKSGSPGAMTEIHYSKKSINKLVGSLKGQIVERLKGTTINGDLNIQINFNHIENINLDLNPEEDSVKAEFSFVEEFNKRVGISDKK
jgi:biotin operon repressor